MLNKLLIQKYTALFFIAAVTFGCASKNITSKHHLASLEGRLYDITINIFNEEQKISSAVNLDEAVKHYKNIAKYIEQSRSTIKKYKHKSKDIDYLNNIFAIYCTYYGLEKTYNYTIKELIKMKTLNIEIKNIQKEISYLRKKASYMMLKYQKECFNNPENFYIK